MKTYVFVFVVFVVSAFGLNHYYFTPNQEEKQYQKINQQWAEKLYLYGYDDIEISKIGYEDIRVVSFFKEKKTDKGHGILNIKWDERIIWRLTYFGSDLILWDVSIQKRAPLGSWRQLEKRFSVDLPDELVYLQTLEF